MHIGELQTVKRLLPFASWVSRTVEGIPFDLQGLQSSDSVMVAPFTKKDGDWYIGLIEEKRPIFRGDETLMAFPAGKIEKEQKPEQAACLEGKQEGGIIFHSLRKIAEAMPFLHICSEKVYFFGGLVESLEDTELETGEFIYGMKWIPWNTFKERFKAQTSGNEPFLENKQLDGVSFTMAALLVATFEPETFS